MLRQSFYKLLYHHNFILFCLLTGVSLRIIWVVFLDVKPISDFNWYYQRGLDIAGGRGYSVDGIPTAYWPVGYPGFLAFIFYIFSNSLLLAKGANIVLSLATILLAYLFSKRVFHNEYAARITVFILAFFPNQIAYSSLLATEIFFTFLLLSGAVLFIYAREHFGTIFLSGVIWGLATLTHPQAILVPMIFLLVFYTNLRSLLKPGLALYLTLFLTLAPWIVRNSLVMGTPLLSTNGGINLLIGNSPYSNGKYIWNEDLAALLVGAKNEVDRDIKARQIAMEYMADNPIRTILLWPKKLFYLYRSDVEGISFNQAAMPQPPGKATRITFLGLKIVAQVYYTLILMLFLISFPIILRSRARQYWIGFALMLYFTLIYLIFFGSPRFHYPLIPWVAIYSGIGGIVMLKRHTLRSKAVDPPSMSNDI
jgi:hypothetical protein